MNDRQICPNCGRELQQAGSHFMMFCPCCDTIDAEEVQKAQEMTLEEYTEYRANKRRQCRDRID